MKVRVFAVIEVCVWLPDALQHPVTDGQGLQVPAELETPVDPALPEIAVHLVSLQHR